MGAGWRRLEEAAARRRGRGGRVAGGVRGRVQRGGARVVWRVCAGRAAGGRGRRLPDGMGFTGGAPLRAAARFARVAARGSVSAIIWPPGLRQDREDGRIAAPVALGEAPARAGRPSRGLCCGCTDAQTAVARRARIRCQWRGTVCVRVCAGRAAGGRAGGLPDGMGSTGGAPLRAAARFARWRAARSLFAIIWPLGLRQDREDGRIAVLPRVERGSSPRGQRPAQRPPGRGRSGDRPSVPAGDMQR